MTKVKITLPSEMPEVRAEIEALISVVNRKTASVRSRTRGRLGEVMASTLFPKNIRDKVQLDRATFDTPFGQRRIDNFLPESRQAVESKYLRATASKRIREQIKKDTYLLQTGVLSEVVWVLFYGGSSKLVQLLTDCNIQIVDCWDALAEEGKKESDAENRVIKIRA